MTDDTVSPVTTMEHEGRSVLGIDTGLTPEAFAKAKLSSLLTEESYQVSPEGTIAVWKPEGAVERDGHIYLWGAAFQGTPLLTLVEQNEALACEALSRWIEARKRLSVEQRARQRPIPAAALIATDGSVLLLGSQLTIRALDRKSPQERIEGVDRWLQPDLDGEELESFAWASIAYRILCGKPPYTKMDPEELKREMRDRAFLGIRFCRFELRPEIAAAIDAALAPRSQAPQKNLRPTPAQLSDLLCVGKGNLFRSVTADEKVALEKERENAIKKQELIAGSLGFWRRNRTRIIGGAVAALIVGVVALSLVQNALRQPTTKGMTPRQVVETYYGAFGNLDHLLMQACVREKAGAQDVEVATNLFVIGKMREAYAQHKTAFPAADWVKAGKPKTEAIIYGVTDLELAEAALAPPGRRSIEARYTLWYPDYDSSDTHGATDAKKQGALVLSVRRVDKLNLAEKKGLWHIVKIDRTELK